MAFPRGKAMLGLSMLAESDELREASGVYVMECNGMYTYNIV